jgi:outer membrane protein assembly factor BamB
MKRWLALPLLSGMVLATIAADWRQFRGTDSTGVAPAGEKAPTAFAADKHIAWKAELPGRGLSSPIVVGDQVFVTTSDGPRQDRLSVLSFDTASGRRLWERSFWATGPTEAHPKTCMAAPTPVSDGQRIIALFATSDLVALDKSGAVLWVRSLYEENPGATDGRGLAASPLLIGSTVIIYLENQNNSFALGIDVANGTNRWRIDRPREPAWASPIAVPGRKPGEQLALLQGPTRLSAVDPLTGQEVWHYERESDNVASSALAGNVLYVPGEKTLAALELPPGGKAPKLRWEKPRLIAGMASPVVLGKRLYSIRGSILVSADIDTGEVIGQLRLSGTFSASIVAAGGLLYCINEEGVAQVVRPGDKEDRRIHSGALGEGVLATPAIAGGALYIRGDKHLWKVAQK